MVLLEIFLNFYATFFFVKKEQIVLNGQHLSCHVTPRVPRGSILGRLLLLVSNDLSQNCKRLAGATFSSDK